MTTASSSSEEDKEEVLEVKQLQELEVAQEDGALRTAVQHHLKAIR